MILFLDDNEARTKKFLRRFPNALTTETASGMINLLKENQPVDTLFLDHDLGDETYVDSARTDCGMEVVRWMMTHHPKVGEIYVHTCNEYAGKTMTSLLKYAGYTVHRVPFVYLSL